MIHTRYDNGLNFNERITMHVLAGNCGDILASIQSPPSIETLSRAILAALALLFVSMTSDTIIQRLIRTVGHCVV